MTNEKFRDFVNGARLRAGGLTHLAEQTGYVRRTLKNWASGDRQPRVPKMTAFIKDVRAKFGDIVPASKSDRDSSQHRGVEIPLDGLAKEIRERNGWQIAEIAYQLRMTIREIEKIESGRVAPGKRIMYDAYIRQLGRRKLAK